MLWQSKPNRFSIKLMGRLTLKTSWPCSWKTAHSGSRSSLMFKKSKLSSHSPNSLNTNHRTKRKLFLCSIWLKIFLTTLGLRGKNPWNAFYQGICQSKMTCCKQKLNTAFSFGMHVLLHKRRIISAHQVIQVPRGTLCVNNSSNNSRTRIISTFQTPLVWISTLTLTM